MKKKIGVNLPPNKLLKKLYDHGVYNVQSKNILHNFIKVKKNSVLVKNNHKFVEYKDFKHIYIICIGKASVDMAETSKKILKNVKKKIKPGIIVVNKENAKNVSGFKTFVTGHPIPNSKGLEASKYLERFLKNSGNDDLVLIFLSGGGSALLPYPVENISLKEKINVNKYLLESGANIKEINTVRKHLSRIKGGNLIKFTYPSKVHCLILSDVIGDDLSSISSGLTSPDQTHFRDAKKILQKYKLWNTIPMNVKSYISSGINNSLLETPKPKNKLFKTVKNTIIGSNNLCIKSINDFCKINGIKSKIWFKNIELDVKDLAKKFYEELKKFKKFTNATVLISGGETTVKIKGSGKGGRNQEFALHFLQIMRSKLPNQNYFLLSAGTDGRDGPTNAAGAIINSNTHNLIKEKKIDLTKELKNNNSYEVLKKINSLVIIKGTNTNVADVQILFIY